MRLTKSVFLYAALAGAGAYAQADEVDVLVVGGGATGAYAAVRLREDYNKTVLVVEKANRLVSLPPPPKKRKTESVIHLATDKTAKGWPCPRLLIGQRSTSKLWCTSIPESSDNHRLLQAFRCGPDQP